MARSFLGPATAKNAMLVTLLEHGTDYFWGDFDVNGRLKALAANEHNRWMLWHHVGNCADVDWQGIADVMIASGEPFYYKGPFKQWQPLHRIIGAERTFTRVSFVLCKLTETSAVERGTIAAVSGAIAANQVRQCTRAHLEELARFYEQAGSMRRSLAKLGKIMDRQQRFYAVWEEGRIASAAFTEFEGDDFATIICVYTDPSKRRLGYSENCVHELTRTLWLDGKIAWLYWNNPAAGRIYHRLGYRPDGLWIRCNYDAVPQAGTSADQADMAGIKEGQANGAGDCRSRTRDRESSAC